MSIPSKYSSWPSPKVAESRSALIYLRDTLNSLDHGQPEIEAALCRFLVIRSCGHVEFTLEQGMLDALVTQTPPRLINYVESSLFKGKNPRPGRLEDFLGSFHKPWEGEIKEFLNQDDELLKRELEFLVDRRNKIAHGQSEGIGRVKALDLCDYSLRVADRLLEIICPEELRSSP